MRLLIPTSIAAVLLAATPGVHARTRRGDVPVTERVQYGAASWYGSAWRGRTTASGALFDERELTAAHRTLPLGTKVQVTNLKNGRSVVVKVTDRGPRSRHRLIDLSHAAAQRLGFTHHGLTPVKVSVVSAPEPPASAPAGSNQAW